jgi:hypothetical protein
MSEKAKLINHFAKIELIKKDKKLIGIKPFDKEKEWDNFNYSLFKLRKKLSVFDAEFLLIERRRIYEVQEKEFKILLKFVKWFKEQRNKVEASKKFIYYIVINYSNTTDLKIINWKIAEGSEIKETFINSFLSVMNIRMRYAYKIVECLESIIIGKSQRGITDQNGKRQGRRKTVYTWETMFKDSTNSVAIFEVLKNDRDFQNYLKTSYKTGIASLFRFLIEKEITHNLTQINCTEIAKNKFELEFDQTLLRPSNYSSKPYEHFEKVLKKFIPNNS